MLHNNIYYYNKYLPYNNLYSRSTPVYPFIPSTPADNSTINIDNINDNISESDNLNKNEQTEITKETSNSKRSFLSSLSFKMDDIIIIGIVIFLLLENKKDYLLIIILGLMLFDISLDTFSNIGIIKNLFNTG